LAACGDGGVEENATVSVYVSGPLSGKEGGVGRAQCGTAGRELQRHGAQAGEGEGRVLCLDSASGGDRWTLASIGANARRATEDSTTVGYIGETSPAATKFSEPILEAAGIAQVSGKSGKAALAELFAAIEDAGDAGGLREAVAERVG